MNRILLTAWALLFPAACTALGAAGVFLLRRTSRPCTQRILCGMAAGAETAAAEVVLALRDSTLSDLRLVGVLAWEERTNNWSEPDRDRFFAVMERCDGEIMLQTAYTEGALERQREYLLQSSEYRLFAA